MYSESEAESQLILDLRKVAGITEGDRFTALVDGVPVTVDYTSGSSSSLTLSVPYRRGATPPVTTTSYRGAPARAPRAPRPLAIELRRETEADRASKRRGVDREVQTGDAAFDEDVYVDTRAPDDAVTWVLAPDEVRASVRALLDLGFVRVRLDDDGRHTAYLSAFASRSEQPWRAGKMVAAMARLAQTVPWVESSGAPPPDRVKQLGTGLLVVAGVGFCAQIPLALRAAPPGCVTSDDEGTSLHCIEVAGQNCCAPLGYGVAIGGPLGLVLGLLVSAPIRGRSSASRLRAMVGFGVLGVVIDAAIVIAQAVLWR